MYCLLVVVTICLQGALAVSHPEVWGEEPDQSDIDNGQCIPIKCVMGLPPEKCTSLCGLRHYIPTCKPPTYFCLCQRLVGNKVELVSPDEVEDQPPEPVKTVHSYILTVLLPIRSWFTEDPAHPLPTHEPVVVNVHEGRLFWDFRYILTGLFLIMVGLVAYELWMCKLQNTSKEPTEWKITQMYST